MSETFPPFLSRLSGDAAAGSGAPARPSEFLEPDTLAVGAMFPTPLVTSRLAGHMALNAALTATILARETVELSSQMSNVGGWHSHDFVTWAGPAGHAVIEAAREMVDSMTLMETADEVVPARVTWRITAWANINRKGNSNRPHCHPAAYWSGVYWVDDGGVAEDSSVGGSFEIADPRGVAPLMHAPHLRFAVKDCMGDGHGLSLAPRAGTMILFPAWLVHSVRPYAGDRSRISVSFNFSL